MTGLAEFLWRWFPWAMMSVLMPGLMYVAVQQDIRQSANDPQIQMAEDAAAILQQGGQVGAVIGGQIVDADKSLAPFIIVYDAEGKVLASNGQLDGKTPSLPSEVINDLNNNQRNIIESPIGAGELRFTWQPKSGVRLAAVLTKFNGSRPGFVLAARNLREVERREQRMMTISALASLFWLAATAFWTFLRLKIRNAS